MHTGDFLYTDIIFIYYISNDKNSHLLCNEICYIFDYLLLPTGILCTLNFSKTLSTNDSTCNLVHVY